MDYDGREIGGYLELEHFGGHEYHRDAIALNCARNCLVYLIQARGITRIWIPSYLCSSVKTAAERAGVTVIGYEIAADFTPDYRSTHIDAGDHLYVVDYFGQLTNQSLWDAAERSKGHLIVDEVHGFFKEPLQDVDTLYCCRKFFGVPDGAYLYTSAKLEYSLERDESRGRMTHLLGRLETTGSEYYRHYVENDRLFSNEPVKLMSKLTHNLLQGIDYAQAAKVRSENYAFLSERLGKLNILNPRETPGPYMYPLLIENTSIIRKEMQARKIYVPLLWPGCPDQGVGGRYAQGILPLPVDQRYTIEDMSYMCDMLGSILGF